jgi:multiple sugar transport system permease protein
VPRAGSAAPKRFLRRYGKHYAGLAPFLALFALFILYPMFYGLVMSFTDWSTKVNAKTAFVGLDNFRAVLGSGTQQGRRFLTSLGNLVWFVALVVPLNLCLATLISLVLNQFTGRLHNFLRSAYFVPYIAPFFLATGVWLWMISANTGVVSVLLAGLGIGQGVVWRLTPGYFLALMIMVDLWRAIGFNMIILTAGMKNIPEELYEASTIDGATTFQQWFRITLPMLEPVLFFVIINCFIGAIQAYDIPWVLSNSSAVGVIGGKQAFASFPVMEIIGNVYSGKAANLGRACAQGLVLMAIIFLITAAQVAYRGRRSRV